MPASSGAIVSTENIVVAARERALAKISNEWKGSGFTAARNAAFELGFLAAGGLLSQHKADEFWKRRFTVQLVDEKWRSNVHESFHYGYSCVVTLNDLLEKYSPVAANDNEPPLPVIDPRDWQDVPIPEREWFVDGFIPSRTVTNLTGDGGSGRTEIMLQLIAASSLGLPWFGKAVAPGPCLYFGAEDEGDELHRRLAKIVARSGRKLSELDDVRLVPMAERDAVLAEPNKAGKILKTSIFQQLEWEAHKLQPKLIVIDPSADVFGGDEINRGQVRTFVSMLRTLAINLDCAVLLLSHPSISGMIAGTGSSGSTGWRNSVRSRLYLMVPTVRSKPDPDIRVLQVQKANYAALARKSGCDGTMESTNWTKGLTPLWPTSSIPRSILFLSNYLGCSLNKARTSGPSPAQRTRRPRWHSIRRARASARSSLPIQCSAYSIQRPSRC
jgi:hypothetical protein